MGLYGYLIYWDFSHSIDAHVKTKKVKAQKTLVNKVAKKVKKNHLPLKKPALYKQNAAGDIVMNKQDQIVLDDVMPKPVVGKSPKPFPMLNQTQEIIISDSSDSNSTEDTEDMGNDFENDMICPDCEKHWALCSCPCESISSDVSDSEDWGNLSGTQINRIKDMRMGFINNNNNNNNKCDSEEF